MSIRVLHISDIHFKKFNEGKGHWDLDMNIRNEVELDLGAFCKANGPINAVLVGGDIAFSGSVDEYEAADEWLRKVSGIVGCEPEHILTIPGNHDVDRTKVRGMLLNNHKQFRRLTKRTEIDEMIYSVLENDADAELFLKPFDNYNKFAAKYGSIPETGNRLFWEKSLELGEFKIRVRGVNSALISNAEDDENMNKLILSSHQTNLKREPGTINVFMCHHPPPWLADKDGVETDVLAKAAIQLYGHRHKEDSRKVNECLILSAGAIQPPRGEDGWQPCYNIIDLDVVEKEKKTFLKVKVWKRMLDQERTLKFIPKYNIHGSDFDQYELRLEDVITEFKPPPEVKKVGRRTADSITQSQKATVGIEENEQVELIDVNKQDYIRKLAYMFLSLPYHKKLKIAVGLDLCAESDEALPDLQKSQMYIKRAKENHKLKELWDETVSNQPEPIELPNPF